MSDLTTLKRKQALDDNKQPGSSNSKRRRAERENDQDQRNIEPGIALVRENSGHSLKPSNTNDEYTVGWICAIHTEYIAARCFLDEEHSAPVRVSPRDNNVYTLGKMGNHNVVIAVLPMGEYGIGAAASVASDMLSSFPNVRLELMVGVGGGAPTRKHDIRLGDVVVSIPRGGHGGVFAYDFGKTIQNQKFQVTGFLNQPPRLLRAAVSHLAARYEEQGHQLEMAINAALQKKPNLQKKYCRPDKNSDKLYKSTITHDKGDDIDCSIACGDGESELVSRPEREGGETLVIHYGTIASANQVMKNALIRDQLAGEKEVLCFEMEAAGLMNHFPCLVVRGICDYSDSHKNKEWQEYAALTAAAYAKDLLCQINPSRVQEEKKLSDILHNC
jgi:nucleoside phosphorylase